MEQQNFKTKCSKEAWNEFQQSAQIAKDVHKRNSHKLDYPHNINILPTLSAKL